MSIPPEKQQRRIPLMTNMAKSSTTKLLRKHPKCHKMPLFPLSHTLGVFPKHPDANHEEAFIFRKKSLQFAMRETSSEQPRSTSSRKWETYLNFCVNGTSLGDSLSSPYFYPSHDIFFVTQLLGRPDSDATSCSTSSLRLALRVAGKRKDITLIGSMGRTVYLPT